MSRTKVEGNKHDRCHMKTLFYSYENWKLYEGLCLARGLVVPPYPTELVLVVSDQGDALAGACLYETEGPWVMGEHLVTSATADPVDTGRALQECIEGTQAYAMEAGKSLVSGITPKLARVVERLGFKPTGGVQYVWSPEIVQAGTHKR